MWRPNEIGSVIAERDLEFKQDKMVSKVTLRFGQPVRSPKKEEIEQWWCPIQIEGIGDTIFTSIAGMDSFHCLLMALLYSKNNLPIYAKKAGGVIYWLAEEMDCIFDQQDLIEALSITQGEIFQALRDLDCQLRESNTIDKEHLQNKISQLLDKYDEKNTNERKSSSNKSL